MPCRPGRTTDELSEWTLRGAPHQGSRPDDAGRVPRPEERPALHYTQTGRRWDGINKGLKAWKGQFPNYADCSSFATWCLWNGLDHFGVRDVVNGANWKAGYTGTILNHGKLVKKQSNWMRGDLIVYGNGFPGEHVAIYIGDGLVISHGSEPAPVKVRWNYRGDFMQCRRFI
jgi:cell wall-associated NlpC family hydrolase